MRRNNRIITFPPDEKKMTSGQALLCRKAAVDQQNGQRLFTKAWRHHMRGKPKASLTISFAWGNTVVARCEAKGGTQPRVPARAALDG